jgi:hypothetical protein
MEKQGRQVSDAAIAYTTEVYIINYMWYCMKFVLLCHCCTVVSSTALAHQCRIMRSAASATTAAAASATCFDKVLVVSAKHLTVVCLPCMALVAVVYTSTSLQCLLPSDLHKDKRNCQQRNSQ